MNFRNAPCLIKYSEYEHAIDTYLERVTNIQGVSSVYTMGSIGAPGLSDIDIIIVVKDDFSPNLSANLSTLDIDSRLFIHGPVIIPQSMTGDFQYIIYATGLKKLHGSDILPNFSDLDNSTAKILRLCYLIDFLESRQIQYTHALSVKEVDQRAWMARLWSLTHSEKLFLDSNLELHKNDRNTLGKIKNLRSKWLIKSMFDSSLFKKTFYESIQVSKNLLMAALQDLHSEHPSCYKKTKSIVTGNKKFFFDEQENLCSYRMATLSMMGKKSFFYTATWNPIYVEHLKKYGIIKDRNCCQRKSAKSDILLKRALIVKKHWNWLDVTCPYAGAMAGYLSFRMNNQKIIQKFISELCTRFFCRN